MAKRRCLKRAAGKTKCLKYAKSSKPRSKKRGKKNCKYGVNKNTGACLKHKRARKR